MLVAMWWSWYGCGNSYDGHGGDCGDGDARDSGGGHDDDDDVLEIF